MRKNKVRNLLIASTLIMSLSGRAADGHIDLKKYIGHTNLTEYTDGTGATLRYGLDFKINFEVLTPRLVLTLGGDAAFGSKYFTQAAGTAQLTLKNLGPFDIFIGHRSLHNFDYQSVDGRRFENDDHLGMRFNFGKK